ncbi:hypothetical protein RJ639_016528 [Escallonia herrerae]|uniref:Protein FAR1-RELATED SEQUENCE n=1 Tax=Escallonia herrerae TaxID=1293975 RepID=A0AA88VAI7_9ASTE|nr:hypothetical protein RJ639_016528 [Escallonia herrerae]
MVKMTASIAMLMDIGGCSNTLSWSSMDKQADDNEQELDDKMKLQDPSFFYSIQLDENDLTDQSAAMASAMGEVFHETNHRLCVWHIYQNAAKHLSHVFHASKEFASGLSSCVYDYEDEDEDELMHAWNQILKTYSLQDNDWLKGIFELREKWAMKWPRAPAQVKDAAVGSGAFVGARTLTTAGGWIWTSVGCGGTDVDE